jgi:hypothetical protein
MSTESIFNPNDLAALRKRMQGLQPTTPARWGTMNALAMVDHLNKHLELVLGRHKAKRLGFGLTEALARWLFIGKLAFPKNLQTLPAIVGKVTPGDTAALAQLLAQQTALQDEVVAAQQAGFTFPNNPVFGRLTHAQLGRLVWKHIDHHLRQFGR